MSAPTTSFGSLDRIVARALPQSTFRAKNARSRSGTSVDTSSRHPKSWRRTAISSV